jgi:isoamylase
VLQMVMDSLRYWVEEMEVDGFRFDLGTILGREPEGFDQRGGFFDAVMQDPVLAKVKLIGEPWDIGPGGYQLGNHPPGFAEWNDRFRDGVRRFWRGDAGQRPSIAARLTASADIFEHQHRRPHASVNYVASHDGFTLADLLAYAHKHNEANREDNRDGHSEEYSANWGAEGPSEDPAVRAVRGRLQRAMLATVMLAQGTPMLLAGDEFGRSQSGNNNAYCQDNEIAWIDWSLAEGAEGVALAAFMGRLAQLRKDLPVLRLDTYLHAATEVLPGIRDTAWFDETGHALSMDAWNDPKGRCLTFRRAAPDGEGKVDVVLLLLNASAGDIEFRLPAPALPYFLLIDSADPNRGHRALEGTTTVAARSLQLLGAILDGT